MFEFILFAFYTLIISHHICCFSVHSSARLFAQSSVFDVSEFLLIHSSIFTSKQLKNINITTLTHQNNHLNFTFVCTPTINKDIKKSKTVNFSHYILLYFTNQNCFHISFHQKVISKNITQH